MLTGNYLFLSLGGTVFTIVLPTQMHFFLSYRILYDCTGHVEGSCMGTDISIASANCNHPNCKPRCTYQVLKFSNWSRNCYSRVHSLLRLSSAWSSSYMRKHQMLRSVVRSRVQFFSAWWVATISYCIRLDRAMLRSLPVRSFQPKVRSLHRISYFATNISYFAPCCNVT